MRRVSGAGAAVLFSAVLASAGTVRAQGGLTDGGKLLLTGGVTNIEAPRAAALRVGR